MNKCGGVFTSSEIPDLDWEKQGGMIPAIVQDKKDGVVQMVGWMTPEALEKTIETGNVTFWSRTRNELWTKGETSGNFLRLDSLTKDCEGGDTLVVTAEPAGPTCSEGNRSCFDGLDDEGRPKTFVGDVALRQSLWALGSEVEQIDATVDERVAQIQDETVRSYSLGLLRDPNKAAKKLGEEFLEFVQAVNREEVAAIEQELADLVFAALTFARANGKNVSFLKTIQVETFRNRAKRSGSDERFDLPPEGAQDGTL